MCRKYYNILNTMTVNSYDYDRTYSTNNKIEKFEASETQ